MTQMTIQNAATTNLFTLIVNDAAARIDCQIREFLQGDSEGAELLDALYGDVIDEPIPARLTALLRR
jgi:hypothetical protein